MFKKILSLTAAAAVILSLAAALPQGALTNDRDISALAAESDCSDIGFDVTYSQTQARGMVDLINDFRTGNDAWAWNSSDSEKVWYTGLGELDIDPELEKIAMQRAAELVVLYSHTRPNGERCFSAYTGSFAYAGGGENIAISSGSWSAEDVFEAWREDNDKYSGQGHRRNMLGSFKTIGIACVKYEGATYWVQEFSSLGATATLSTANDSLTPVTVSVENSKVSKDELGISKTMISVDEGKTAALPTVTRKIRHSEQWAYAPDITLSVSPVWKITSGSDKVSLSGSSVKGIKEGAAELKAEADGKSVALTVQVEHIHSFTSKVTAPTYTSDGYTEYTCTGCGYSYKDDPTPKLARTDISTAVITGVANKVYTGAAFKPEPTVKVAEKKLKKGTDYTVSYKNNKKIGTATVTVKGKGAYEGTAVKTFKIKPAATKISKLTTPKKAQLKVKYKKVTGVTGYQVKYSTSKSFSKSASKSVTVKGASTLTKTVKSLKSGKTYYVKVRAYKTVGGVKYYSSYSAVKKVKVK